MSKQYDEYLTNHIQSVLDSYEFLCDSGVFSRIPDLTEQIKNHDKSKYSKEEYKAYDTYFNEFPGEDKPWWVVEDFNYAWCHHLHNNPHHWQYWVLIPDPKDEQTVLDMPEVYLHEMICDWLSFSMLKYNQSGNPSDLWGFVDWYQSNKDEIKLSVDTRDRVEKIVRDVSNVIVQLEDLRD